MRQDAIRFGLSAVRNVGEGVAELIIGRGDGPYVDFYDFCERVDPSVLNKRAIESLIKAGGVRLARPPTTGSARRCSSRSSTATLRRRRERDQGTMSLFDSGARHDGSPVFDDRSRFPTSSSRSRSGCALEKEMLGLYVSDHPLMGAEPVLRRHVECSIADLAEIDDGSVRTVAGIVTGLSASTPSAATSWARSCSKISRPPSR